LKVSKETSQYRGDQRDSENVDAIVPGIKVLKVQDITIPGIKAKSAIHTSSQQGSVNLRTWERTLHEWLGSILIACSPSGHSKRLITREGVT
jgi:hypothetical protein